MDSANIVTSSEQKRKELKTRILSQPVTPEEGRLEVVKDTRNEVMDKMASKITNQNAKEWVENHLFADVKIAMKNLIDHI